MKTTKIFAATTTITFLLLAVTVVKIDYQRSSKLMVITVWSAGRN
jgi:hypothetical protein